MGENYTGIDFVLIKKYWLFLQTVKIIPGKLHHAFVVADIDKKKMLIFVENHVLREER